MSPVMPPLEARQSTLKLFNGIIGIWSPIWGVTEKNPHKRRWIAQSHSSPHFQHNNRLIIEPLRLALKAADVAVQGVGDLLRGGLVLAA